MLEGPFIGIYLEANSRLQLARTQKKTQNKTEKRREARSGTSCNLQLGVWDPSARTAGSTVGLRITCLGITGLSGETSPCIWLSNAFALVTNDPYEIIVPGLPLPPTRKVPLGHTTSIMESSQPTPCGGTSFSGRRILSFGFFLLTTTPVQ